MSNYSRNLSVFLFRYCTARKLSYERASEQCDISSRYFGEIVRGEVSPSIRILEKICVGFDVTPNEILLDECEPHIPKFLTPMQVQFVRCYRTSHGLEGYPICPGCNSTLEREHQPHCDRCGQKLDWTEFSKAVVVMPYNSV